MVQTRLHKHSLSKKEQAVSSVASRASVRDPIDEFQDVYGSRAASAAFRQQIGSDFSRSGQIQPPIQAKPSFRGLSQELAIESQPVQLREEENKTGLPDDLKAGVENLSDFSLDDVRVHYNSSKPAQLQALAYTQGTEIHVGPGQEKHLPHEAWHVVQQMQGRVKPTMQMKGVQINDDDGLEREADVMERRGAKGGQELTHVVQQTQMNQNNAKIQAIPQISCASETIQRRGSFKRGSTLLNDMKTTADLSNYHGERCGTEMTFEIHIDVPVKQKTGGEDYSDFQNSMDRSPYSINGLTLEYWEDITVDYNFVAENENDQSVQNRKESTEGAFHKPWNDIYAFRPIAPTFASYGELSWQTAVRKAARGSLEAGERVVTVKDFPALTPRDGKYAKRTLRFKVVVKDLKGNQKVIYATQFLTMENGEIIQNIYEDTAGNRNTYFVIGIDNDDKSNEAIAVETEHNIRSQLPNDYLNSISKFYDQIIESNTTSFNFLEADQVAQIEYPNGIPDDLYYSNFMSDIFWFSILRAEGAGTYGLPGLKNGEKYVQYTIDGERLFVARVKGSKISKMYFTDGTKKTKKYKEQNVEVRQFIEIPSSTIEIFKSRL